ncbi:MAG: sodium-dependent transporter [Clostridiales Family XIII bacterium]|jgi:NSS family neurotransmitter:Na+ symporter|nr:sodium-dependent transporter [Clostridiales Family XIII bacterium]
MKQREKLGSRLGFILLSAGCAIGLGNVWRFPYITGENGGATFVLIYIFFLVVFGIPIMTMEFGIGRGSQRSFATAYRALEPAGTTWHRYSWFAMAGNYLLMMFYTVISGWLLAFLVGMARGDFEGASPEEVGARFGAVAGSTAQNVLWMVIACVIGMLICLGGVQAGVERITKGMMVCLFAIMVVLVVQAVRMPGAEAGLTFYLKPDLDGIREHGLWAVVYDALGQSFFTLSLGVGSMAIFGSYLGKDRRLFGESVTVTLLDTSVAIMAGLIIFPACFAYGVEPGAGPTLIFQTLPNIFAGMGATGRVLGTAFFVFLVFAALSTIVAVFENIVAFGMDLGGWSRRKSVAVNLVALPLLSLPCTLGMTVWSGFQPFGAGTGVLDLEDFLVSNNLLPIGCLVVVVFCLYRRGWGYENFLAEADQGRGLKFPAKLKIYYKYALPVILAGIFVMGYVDKARQLGPGILAVGIAIIACTFAFLLRNVRSKAKPTAGAPPESV